MVAAMSDPSDKETSGGDTRSQTSRRSLSALLDQLR